tara:strand:+ start:306 stop:1025 length:720 start_codon:yes stop_codon:yes gene_type:complete
MAEANNESNSSKINSSKGERIFTGIGIVFYIIGFGLSVGSSYLIFKDLTGVSSDLPDTKTGNLRQSIEILSLALCSFPILMAVFCFLGTVSSVRICFNMKKDGGDHLTLLVFNCILLFLSFVSLLSFGLVYAAESSSDVSPGIEITLPFYTSLVISIISFIFIIIYVAKPSYIVDLPLIEGRLNTLEGKDNETGGDKNNETAAAAADKNNETGTAETGADKNNETGTAETETMKQEQQD